MTHNAMPCNKAHTSFLCLFVCTSTHYMSLHISQKARKSLQSEAADSNRGAPLESFPARTGSLWLSPGGSRGPQPFTLSSLTLNRHSSTNTYEDGGVFCVCTLERERERQRPRGRHQKGETDETEKKRETLTHKQNATSFKPQLRAFDDIFFISSSQSLPCKESNYMSRTIPH